MKPIYIYTNEFSLTGKIKVLLKRILGKSFGGPKAVSESFIRGCEALKQPFFINKKNPIHGSNAIVLNGMHSLSWVLRKKRSGVFSKIIAGPNIFVSPLENHGMAQDKLIDYYLVPSLWVKRLWEQVAPKMTNIVVSPAGVKDTGSLVRSEGPVMIYVKYTPKRLLNFVVKYLIDCGLEFQIIQYGHHTHTEYLNLLSKSSSAIFLSPSESQGLALHEAWMANLPTLIWSPGSLVFDWGEVRDPLVSCPYFNPVCGEVFTGEQDFTMKANPFFKNLNNYQPRQYSIQHFTDIATTKLILDLLD